MNIIHDETEVARRQRAHRIAFTQTLARAGHDPERFAADMDAWWPHSVPARPRGATA